MSRVHVVHRRRTRRAKSRTHRPPHRFRAACHACDERDPPTFRRDQVLHTRRRGVVRASNLVVFARPRSATIVSSTPHTLSMYRFMSSPARLAPIGQADDTRQRCPLCGPVTPCCGEPPRSFPDHVLPGCPLEHVSESKIRRHVSNPGDSAEPTTINSTQTPRRPGPVLPPLCV